MLLFAAQEGDVEQFLARFEASWRTRGAFSARVSVEWECTLEEGASSASGTLRRGEEGEVVLEHGGRGIERCLEILRKVWGPDLREAFDITIRRHREDLAPAVTLAGGQGTAPGEVVLGGRRRSGVLVADDGAAPDEDATLLTLTPRKAQGLPPSGRVQLQVNPESMWIERVIMDGPTSRTTVAVELPGSIDK
jgi:hypothetical protein